jgi:pyruvate/2-oxoglutarate/acetoin dehydrogenase E1 component
MIEYTSYKDQLTEVMKMCAEVENSVFIGQQIVWKGNPMSTTLDHVPKEKMIEVPVMEETQMGMSLGLGITGKFVVTFYPRWDFIICATNQLVNHLDKYELMAGETPHIIIRVGKGSDTPLDPGHQHKGNYIEEFRSMLKTIKVLDCPTVEDIRKNYEFAIKNKGIYIINEYPQKYYE